MTVCKIWYSCWIFSIIHKDRSITTSQVGFYVMIFNFLIHPYLCINILLWGKRNHKFHWTLVDVMSIKHLLFYNWQEILHLRFWCICDCDTKAKLAPADSATAEEKAIYSKASAQCSMLMLVHMYDCLYMSAVMCTVHTVHTKACVNEIWGRWWNSILSIWLPSVVYLCNQENIYFIARRCIMYILISENLNGMVYLWIYDWYIFPVKEQIHGSAKYS